MKAVSVFFGVGVLIAHAQVKPSVSQRSFNEEVNIVHLAPRYATVIKMPEAVSSVIVGDPSKFLAEHSDKEPTLVLVKPVVEEPAESNLLVTTVRGQQVSFVLRSEGAAAKPVDFVLTYKPAGMFLVEESGIGTAEVALTDRINPTSAAQANPLVRPARTRSHSGADRTRSVGQPLRQQRASLPALYGPRAPSAEGKGEHVRAGVSEVMDEGRTVIVLFSVVNPQSTAIEILPPQVQLAGKVHKGGIARGTRWGTSEQLPVKEFLLSRRRLGHGERADGVVVFARPGFKQASESLSSRSPRVAPSTNRHSHPSASEFRHLQRRWAMVNDTGQNQDPTAVNTAERQESGIDVPSLAQPQGESESQPENPAKQGRVAQFVARLRRPPEATREMKSGERTRGLMILAGTMVACLVLFFGLFTTDSGTNRTDRRTKPSLGRSETASVDPGAATRSTTPQLSVNRQPNEESGELTEKDLLGTMRNRGTPVPTENRPAATTATTPTSHLLGAAH